MNELLANQVRIAHDGEKVEAARRWQAWEASDRKDTDTHKEYLVHLGRAQGLARAYALVLGVEFVDNDNGHVTTDVWRLADK